LVTSGDDLVSLDGFLGGRDRYVATDVIAYLLSGPASLPEKAVMGRGSPLAPDSLVANDRRRRRQ
jgi:hypothetical protein